MATEGDLLITKATVILERPGDWQRWLFLRKDSAERNDLWQYLDPSLKAEQVKRIEQEKPKEKEIKEFYTGDARDGEITILDLSEKDVSRYELWLKVFTRKEAQWSKKEKALREFNHEISRTIASRHIHLISDCSTPYDRLKALKKHLCPSTSERNYQLRAHYQELLTLPKRSNLDTWFEDWLDTTRLMKEAALPEISGSRAQEDFIRAVRSLDESWATHQLTELIRKDQEEMEFIGISDLVAEYRSYYRRVRPIASSLGSFATLGVAEETPAQGAQGAQRARGAQGVQGVQGGQGSQDKNKGKKKGPTCVCGESHKFQDCPYVNYARRRPGWQPDQQVVRRFDELRAEQSFKASILRQVEARLKNQTQDKAGLHDDGKPQSVSSSGSYAALQTAITAKAEEHPPLINRWILDPGSNTHVANSRSFGWRTTAQAQPGECVYAGGQVLQIEEWGEVELHVNTPTGRQPFKLTYVAYIPGFFTNVLGLSRCRSLDIHFDSGKNCLYQQAPSNPVCYLEYKDGHWLIDADEKARPLPRALQGAAAVSGYRSKPSHQEKKPLELNSARAHTLLGHASYEAISHLSHNVEGVRIAQEDQRSTSWKDCEVCIKAKLHKLISRRVPQDVATRPFYRIGMDLVQLQERGDQCYNGDQWLLHAVDQSTKWHEGACLPDKSGPTLKQAVKRLLAKIQRQFNQAVIVIRLDSERGYSALYELLRDLGIAIEPRAPYTEEQNGGTERAGATIIIRARAIRIEACLPKELSNECVMTAIYLLNRTPIKALTWRTPFEAVHGRKPSLAHLNEIGARAYTLNHALKRGDKLESRALIGQLIGYDSTNIYRIWMPTLSRVIRTRDVIFMRPGQPGGKDYSDEKTLRQLVTVLDIEDPPASDEEVEQALHLARPAIEEIEEADEAEDQLICELRQQEKERQDLSKGFQGLPSPEETPEPDQSDQSDQNDQNDQAEITSSPMPRGWQPIREDQEAPDRVSNNAPRRDEISSQLDQGNIIPSRRTRRMPGAYVTSFMSAIGDQPKQRLHREQLPPPPKRWKDLLKHPFCQEFLEAAKEELHRCFIKGCFVLTSAREEEILEEILPLMWLFSYKFDEDGYLYKHKARLVVRGDLQDDWGDTYAATLAARVFRFLMAIAAAFGLLAYQYDVINAFLNAPLNRKLYAQSPEGFVQELGKLLELKRALYGLKDAPLLWYEHLKKTLKRLGLKPVEGVQCLFTSDRLIVFFYVDDIVVLVHPSHLSHHTQFEQELKKEYEIRSLGELRWFLGIRVLRDKPKRKIYLIQDSFIDKVTSKFDVKPSNRGSGAPLIEDYLEASTEPQNDHRTRTYQQLVGSLAYISTFTRPDVARAHSVLARHLQNPGQKHLSAAYQVWRYLLRTKHLAISASGDAPQNSYYLTKPHEAGDELIFYGASDAAFADDPERKSSQGYLFSLYGLPIDWKATVQRSVTKSTTEAELLALSLAGSELIWWKRLFKHVDFEIGIRPTLFCDNQQTVGIINKAEDRLNTKMRHVDTHQMWLRQEAETGQLQVSWMATDQMPADGLTKSLSSQKHSTFVEQLGLVDISNLLRGHLENEETSHALY